MSEARKIEVFVPMKIPTVTHNSLVIRKSKNGGRFIGKSDELLDAEAKWMSYLISAIRTKYGNGELDKPLSGCLGATLVFFFQTEDKDKFGDWHTKKPDLDNLEKTLWDVLQRINLIEDDSQICSKRVDKLWSDYEGIHLAIREFGN